MGNGHMTPSCEQTDRHMTVSITFPQLCWQVVKITNIKSLLSRDKDERHGV